MVQAFPFVGFMNTDDPDEVINPAHHKDARNIVFKGTLPNLRVENVPGTIEVPNSLLPGTGVNKNIGKLYDAIGKRIFFFNYNSSGSHGIQVYNTIAGTFQILVQVGTNTTGDPLGFTVNGIITSINIIYGDSVQGDILSYVDSLGRPSKVNINRALSGGYGSIQRSFLEVAKEPASIPPYVVYEDDATNAINNCRKKLFRVKVRWVFDDQDKSVTSSQSEMPIPLGVFNQDIDTDQTRNCRLAITYQTGPSNVKKIEILVSNSLGNVMSDYYLVASLDKAVDSIPSNDVATYLFYNDKAYTYIDVTESNQLFDYVPITAGTQTILNGNVLAYGNVTEGYPNLTNFSDGTDTSNITSGETPYYAAEYFAKLIASQSGDSAFGSGAIHIVVRGVIASPAFMLDTFTVYFTDGSDISYTLLVGDDASAVIEGLRVDAIANGFTVISAGDNDLYITKTNISLARTYITSNYTGNLLARTSFNAYDWSSNQAFGLVYFDEDGKTNGAVYTEGFSIQTSPYTEGTPPTDIPRLTARLYHQPPSTAYYFQWVRSKNLSKQNLIQWVSDRTFKDLVALTGLIKYAYVGIESLALFARNNVGTPLGYSFLSGDRIKFLKRYNSDGTTAYLYYNTKDFEIVGLLTNPTINGQERLGQFIKIILPTTDGAFDFGSGFENYFIELYTPAQSVANNLDVYYEYGERYAIENPTLSTRTHQGQLQNQIYLTQPAIYEFVKGDYYVRQRSIQTGNEYLFTIPAMTVNGAMVILIGISFISKTYDDTNITTQSIAYVGQPVFDPFTDGRWHIRAIAVTTFHVTGNIVINLPTTHAGATLSIYLQNRYGEKTYLAPTFDSTNAGVYSFVVDLHITLEDDRLFLLSTGWPTRTVEFISTNLTYTIDKVFQQIIIDPNFSDYYPSAVNSNGRAFVYDSNANQVTFPGMYRWGLAYQRDTNINQSNRFYSQNFDDVERSYGAIIRMMVSGKALTFFQERKCGWTGIYQKFIRDNAGGQQLITTDNIITSNNVQYYDQDHGVGNQGDGVVQNGYVYYFPDPITGDLLRLSRDGITNLTVIYKMKTWSGVNVSNYLRDYAYQFGGNARITGVFNIRKDNVGEYLCVLQGGTSGITSIPGEILGFDESKNSFTSFLDINPDSMVCAENTLFSFRNGKLYKHEGTTRNTFYDQYFDSTITRVFNQNLIQKKTFESLTQVSNVCWDCPVIYTNLISHGATLQQSNLITQDFENLEGNFNASFQRDINSIGGVSDGDVLKGNLIVVKFRAQNAVALVTLSAVLLYYIDSPYTSR